MTISTRRWFGSLGVLAVVVMLLTLAVDVEKHLAAAGLGGTRVDWRQFSGGSTMNDALLSGQLHVAAAGVTPILTIWDKTKGTDLEVKGVAALGSVPVVLVTNNPKVRSIKDFSDKDRIAVPAVRVSIQAVFLQMAAVQAFGEGQHTRLDVLTVAARHELAVRGAGAGERQQPRRAELAGPARADDQRGALTGKRPSARTSRSRSRRCRRTSC